MSTASGHAGVFPWLRYIRFRQKLWMGSSPGTVLEFADGYIQLARDFGAAMMSTNRRPVFSPLPRRSAAYTLRCKAFSCLLLLCCGGLAIFYYISYYKWAFDDLLRFFSRKLVCRFCSKSCFHLSPIHLTILWYWWKLWYPELPRPTFDMHGTLHPIRFPMWGRDLLSYGASGSGR